MDDKRSREAFVAFLDYLADKGLMEKNTALSRKAAVSRVLGILHEDESSDVTAIDVDDLIARFGRLHGKDFTPQSLNTYKSRLRSALDDFRSYLANPLAFRPALRNRTRQRRFPRSSVARPAARTESAGGGCASRERYRANTDSSRSNSAHPGPAI